MLLPPARPNDERHTVCFRKFARTESHSRFPLNSAAVLSDGETAGQARNEVRPSSHACRPLVDISEHILVGIHRGSQSRRGRTLARARRRAIQCHCVTASQEHSVESRIMGAESISARHGTSRIRPRNRLGSRRASPRRRLPAPSTSTPCCSHHTFQGACSFAQNIETERVPI